MIQVVPQTGSTNADLLSRLRLGDKLAENEWLVTDRQTSGRGRQGRDWSDGLGNFMGSTVLFHRDSDPPAQTLALVVGIALYEAVVSSVGHISQLHLKWPNDLMHDDAKLAGILLERERGAIVVGIGVNLVTAPKVEGRQTVSLAKLNKPIDRDAFAAVLQSTVSTEVYRWRETGLDQTLSRWSHRAHLEGSDLAVHPPGEEPISGQFAGLTPEGALRLRITGGEERVIHAGDVSVIGKGD